MFPIQSYGSMSLRCWVWFPERSWAGPLSIFGQLAASMRLSAKQRNAGSYLHFSSFFFEKHKSSSDFSQILKTGANLDLSLKVKWIEEWLYTFWFFRVWLSNQPWQKCFWWRKCYVQSYDSLNSIISMKNWTPTKESLESGSATKMLLQRVGFK